jgi:hypothetical protein
MNRYLSPSFTLEELSFSQVAARKGIDNTPNDFEIANLTRLCAEILEPGRLLLGVPLHIDSGFRAALVNAAVGGARNSAHLDGRAADCIPIGISLQAAFDRLRTSQLPYDQIIIECNAWIHLAIAPTDVPPRREALVASGYPGTWTYHAVISAPA